MVVAGAGNRPDDQVPVGPTSMGPRTAGTRTVYTEFPDFVTVDADRPLRPRLLAWLNGERLRAALPAIRLETRRS